MSKFLTLENWRKLYKIADEFKNLSCWDWMLDGDLFGVQNPETAEIGYCCVMGHLGEHLALAVYSGTEGLNSYFHLTTVEPETAESDDLFSQNCLQVSFEDREQLTKEDREIIKKLGLKYRGSQNWPLFRNYSPGYMPWYLNKGEVELLTLTIEQAMDVCSRVKDNPDLLDAEDENLFLVRVPEKKANKLLWHDEWKKPAPIKPDIQHKPAAFDQFRLQKIRQSTEIVDAVWEFEYFYFPNGVRDGKERPYFPVMLLWGDQDSLLILSHEMTKPAEYQNSIVPQFLNLVEKTQAIPEQVWVGKQDAFDLLQPAASVLGIKLKLRNQLPSIQEIRQSMMNFFF
jgi:hypothetical protein